MDGIVYLAGGRIGAINDQFPLVVTVRGCMLYGRGSRRVHTYTKSNVYTRCRTLWIFSRTCISDSINQLSAVHRLLRAGLGFGRIREK